MCKPSRTLRLALSSTVFALCVLPAGKHASAFEGGSPLCPYYGGHVDVEGKLGSRRDIGETSVFIPAACTEDLLLFSDIRFKADNRDNREGNFGLGVRSLQETGVIGGYAYFDRKKSGVSDKYHSQMTLGAEWLAEGWEARANGYVPLTGDAEVVTGEKSISAPFLQGSGIFARETAQQVLRETALYGGDVEAGFKIPDTGFWLHVAAFSFSGDDAPSLDGVRGRATFQLTENIALTAEGQYDDERGRQGWVGARLTLPFGEPAQKPVGPATRMTASPVRDVDIVTQAQTVKGEGFDRTVPVLNAATGDAQQVIYVDNALGVNGDGTLESPFNNLASAQAALTDNAVLYIASGDGTDTNMQTGLNLTGAHQGVQVIGEGSAFVYDAGRFTTSGDGNLNGQVLRAAGAAPKITNTAVGGDGVSVAASNVTLTGFTVENANRHGIYAAASGGGAADNLLISNVAVTGSGQDGVRVEATGAGSTASAGIVNVSATGNRNGVRFYAANNATVSGAVQSTLVTGNAQHGVIVYDDLTAGSANVDLGGGGASTGNNALFGNTLEDLSLDIDGGNLFAQNNWWGQSSGLYQSAPSGGLKPQIYYGAPINDGLVGHWTFDSEWTSNTTAFDRSGEGNDGAFINGLSLADMVIGNKRQALDMNSLKGIQVADDASLDLSGEATILTVLDKDTRFSGYATHPIEKWIEGGTADANYVLYDFGATSGGFIDNYVFYANRGGVWGTIGTHTYDSPPSTGMRHIGVTYRSASGGQLFIDGSAYAGLGGSGVLATNNYNLRLGGYNGFDGRMDDTRIYNRALSAGEMAELYRMDTTGTVDFSSFRTTAP